MARKRRIGIMGGTFDPIHLGHLVTAEAVRSEFGLDEILFLPAADPPHKKGKKVTDAYHRLIMTHLAVASNPYFTVSRLEMERSGPSYTVDTMRELQQRFGDAAEFFFITGADEVNDLPDWHEPVELLRESRFIAATRHGCKLNRERLEKTFGDLASERIFRLTTPQLEISSTDIREKVRTGVSIRYLVPPAVADYIDKEGLYR